MELYRMYFGGGVWFCLRSVILFRFFHVTASSRFAYVIMSDSGTTSYMVELWCFWNSAIFANMLKSRLPQSFQGLMLFSTL